MSTTSLANCPHPPEAAALRTRAAEESERDHCTFVAELRCTMCGSVIAVTGEGPPAPPEPGTAYPVVAT